MSESQVIESRKCRILIVDDHPVVRRGLRALVQDETDLEICGEAESTEEALQRFEETTPDVIVLDLTLKSGHGLTLIHDIRSKNDTVKILVSSMHDEMLFAERVLRAGAMGYINKQASPEKIIGAIRQIMRGEIYLSSRMANRLLHQSPGDRLPEKSTVERLTDRELQVFQMIGQGLSTKKIAAELSLSHKTVETHREKIKAKLRLKNSTELGRDATRWAMENG
jgi:DNA-binding NarL/FixJ family response regulator